jgi:integrase
MSGLINRTRLSKQGIKKLKEKEYYKDKEEIFYESFLVQAVNFVEFLMLTGLRPDEAKKLEWKNVFLEGNEYNPNPFFVLDKSTRKRKEVYAIAITDMIKKVLDFQKLLIGQGDIVNLASVDIFEEDDNPKKKKLPKYIFMCEHDLHMIAINNYKLRGAPLINKPVSNVRSGFSAIRERMPALKVATSFSPYTLKHTFTTIGNMCGYTNSELDAMTGHVKQGKTATSHYIARLVKDNRQAFKLIHKAMLGDEIKDKDLPKREDDISKKLKKATKEELIIYYHRGLMTAEEVEQYKIIPLLHKAYKQKYK